MTADAFHPDHLRPGNMVGPWRILESLGSGAMGHVFKVELDGEVFALKMAVRPAAGEIPPGDEDIDRRMGHEGSFLLAYDNAPGVLRAVEVSRWPNPRGYRYIVTDMVDGETFHEWRWRTLPSAAKLLDVFTDLVRTLAALHRRGVHHRDLKASNVLVRREDERPVLIDFGSVHLPGATTLTQGLPPGTPYALPPEAIAFVNGETWKTGARFNGGVPGDLYAAGVLLYEALTDCHPFDPVLPVPELMAAIQTRLPPAPHELNPGVPRALSNIAMHLLAKTPDMRFPSAEALLQALWDARKEAKTQAWRAPLPIPPEGSIRTRRRHEASPSEIEETAEEEVPPAPSQQPEEALPRGWLAPGFFFKAKVVLMLLWAFTPRTVRWLALGLGLLLASWLAWTTLAPSLQKGSDPVSSPLRTGYARLAAMLCAATSVGCPGAQVKPPQSENCPEEARRAMFEVLKLTEESDLKAVIDVGQPGDQSELGTYHDGPIVGQVVGYDWADPRLPGGTLLYGRLWTGPGIFWRGEEAVVGRYTEAKLPDGRTFPVCINLGSPIEAGVPKLPDSKPGAAMLPRELPVSVVYRWP